MEKMKTRRIPRDGGTEALQLDAERLRSCRAGDQMGAVLCQVSCAVTSATATCDHFLPLLH